MEFLITTSLMFLFIFGPVFIAGLFSKPNYRGRAMRNYAPPNRSTNGDWPSYKHGQSVKTQTFRQFLDQSDEHTIKYWDKNKREFVEEEPK